MAKPDLLQEGTGKDDALLLEGGTSDEDAEIRYND